MHSPYFIIFTTLIRREMTRYLRIWVQTLLPSLITMFLYFMVFGQIMGDRIQFVHGFKYMVYISPGLIMMPIITNSFSNVSSSLYSMRFQKSIEEMLVAPIPNWLLLSGFVIGGMTRGLIIGVLVTGLVSCFATLPFSHPWILLVIASSTALLFALGGFLNALFARSFDDISVMPTFVLTPLSYLGGVFYPIEALPVFWQKVSMLNPFLYIVNAFRYALLGISDIPIMYALLMIWLFCFGLIGINHYLLKRGVGLRS